MTKYTKVTIKKELYNDVKVRAASLNRSVSNYIEDLILTDFVKNYSSGKPQPKLRKKN